MVLKLLMKDERRYDTGDVIEDIKMLTRSASHRLHGTVPVRQSHKKVVRAKPRPCPEDAKKSDSEEFLSRHGFLLEDGPSPDFNVRKSIVSSYHCVRFSI